MLNALRVEINMIAVCILLILIKNNRSSAKSMPDERLYQVLLGTTLFYALSDSAAWLLDGTRFGQLRLALYAVNILCYLFCVAMPYIWFLYAESRLFEDEEHLVKMSRLFAPSVVLYAAVVLATPFTGWMFSFDAQQMYVRGPLFPLQVILTLFYILFPTFRAIQRLRTAETATERQDCHSIAGFVVLPLLGFFVQVLFYGMPGAIIATVISELMIFINLQNRQISLDTLTHLNNRGQLSRYLNLQARRQTRRGALYMLLLDIDHFKAINDAFGHQVGDKALVDMGILLQRVCGRQGCFAARYGGDEFAIVAEKDTTEEIDQLIREIQAELQHFNDTKKREYQLFASIGYAQFGTDTTQTVDKLIEAADARMYEIKAKRHTEQRSKSLA